MAISGPVLHQQLMDAYTQVQTDLEAARASFSQIHHQRDELKDNRGAALERLAKYYLPELSRESIANAWGDSADAISGVLLRKEDHQRRLKTQIEGLATRRAEAEARLVATNRRLDVAAADLQQREGKVEARLREDARFVELSDRAAVAEAALERAEANLEEIDQEATKKLPAFEKSSLFGYLKDRHFGSDQYRHRGFTRRMDRALAKFIGFTKAKQSYEFLKRTPNQMRKIIGEDRASLTTVMNELQSCHDQVARQLGLPDAIREVETLQAERDSQLADLDQIREEFDTAENEVADVERPRGPYYREAIELVREQMDRVGSGQLRAEARQTPAVTDDQIVAGLLGVEQEIDDLDRATRRRREELEKKREFLSGLGKVIQRFRAAQFDSERSNFVGSLDIVDEIRQAEDRDEVDRVWRNIRQAQRWGSASRQPDSRRSSATQALVNAMGDAAQATFGDHARRAGNRFLHGDSSWGGDSSDSDHRRVGR